MRITRATTDTDRPGLFGIGEGTLNAFAKTVEVAVHELAPRDQGLDPFQVETILPRMTARPLRPRGPG